MRRFSVLRHLNWDVGSVLGGGFCVGKLVGLCWTGSLY